VGLPRLFRVPGVSQGTRMNPLESISNWLNRMRINTCLWILLALHSRSDEVKNFPAGSKEYLRNGKMLNQILLMGMMIENLNVWSNRFGLTYRHRNCILESAIIQNLLCTTTTQKLRTIPFTNRGTISCLLLQVATVLHGVQNVRAAALLYILTADHMCSDHAAARCCGREGRDTGEDKRV
jgi:hypothetical protein